MGKQSLKYLYYGAYCTYLLTYLFITYLLTYLITHDAESFLRS